MESLNPSGCILTGTPLRRSTRAQHCHSPRSTLGLQGATSHRHCLPEGFLRRHACLQTSTPKAHMCNAFVFQFCFSLLSPLPRALGPLSPPFTAPGLWCGGCWLWESSSRWFSSWLVNFPQQREQEPTSLRLPSEPSVSGGGELTPVTSKGDRCFLY